MKKECHYCTEIEVCIAALNDALVLQDVSDSPPCITLYPCFRAICLEKKGLYDNLLENTRQETKTKYSQAGAETE